MKRNRKNSIKKERMIMIASSAFVLTALTLTGIYMKEGSKEAEDNGYTVDFTALEESRADYEELARNIQDSSPENTTARKVQEGADYSAQVTEDDLDYMPMEAGSSLVEIPGLTDGTVLPETESGAAGQDTPEASEGEKQVQQKEEEEKPKEEKPEQIKRELSFQEEEGLTRPVNGQVLLPYSMEGSIYFATLDQYKYNPAVIYAAEEGASVVACAEAQVINIFEDEEIGHAVTLDMGNGYQVTYGQLEGISVTLNSYVEEGDAIAQVAAPTKYFSTEGSNLYFELTKDGAPVNPEDLF